MHLLMTDEPSNFAYKDKKIAQAASWTQHVLTFEVNLW